MIPMTMIGKVRRMFAAPCLTLDRARGCIVAHVVK